jgi:hypothetical protein
MDSSFKYASDSWQQVQESEYAAQASEYAAQAATAVKPHWEWLKEATAPAQVGSDTQLIFLDRCASAVACAIALWMTSGSTCGRFVGVYLAVLLCVMDGHSLLSALVGACRRLWVQCGVWQPCSADRRAYKLSLLLLSPLAANCCSTRAFEQVADV